MTTTTRTWTLTHQDRPPSTNDLMRMHHQAQGRIVKAWRHAFTTLTRQAKVPRLDQITITAQSHLKGNRGRDWGHDMLIIKGAIDGVADACLPLDSMGRGQDDCSHMLGATLLPPVLGAERDALVLTISEVAPSSGERAPWLGQGAV